MVARSIKFMIFAFYLLILKTNLISYPVVVSQLVDGKPLPDFTIQVDEKITSFHVLKQSIALQLRANNKRCYASELIFLVHRINGDKNKVNASCCEHATEKEYQLVMNEVRNQKSKLVIVYGGDPCSFSLNASHKLLIAYDTGKRSPKNEKNIEFMSVFALEDDSVSTIHDRINHLIVCDIQDDCDEDDDDYAVKGNLYLSVSDKEVLSRWALLTNMHELRGFLVPLNVLYKGSSNHAVSLRGPLLYFGTEPAGIVTKEQITSLHQKANNCRMNEHRLHNVCRLLAYCSEYYKYYRVDKKPRIHDSPIKNFHDLFIKLNELIGILNKIDAQSLTLLGKKKFGVVLKNCLCLIKRIKECLLPFNQRIFEVCAPACSELLSGKYAQLFDPLFENPESAQKIYVELDNLLGIWDIPSAQSCFETILNQWLAVVGRFNIPLHQEHKNAENETKSNVSATPAVEAPIAQPAEESMLYELSKMLTDNEESLQAPRPKTSGITPGVVLDWSDDEDEGNGEGIPKLRRNAVDLHNSGEFRVPPSSPCRMLDSFQEPIMAKPAPLPEDANLQSGEYTQTDMDSSGNVYFVNKAGRQFVKKLFPDFYEELPGTKGGPSNRSSLQNRD